MLYRAETRPVVTGHRSHQHSIVSARCSKSAKGRSPVARPGRKKTKNEERSSGRQTFKVV